MIAFYIIIAVFIAWIWVDYYRLIDIYENEKLNYFILTFVLGCAYGCLAGASGKTTKRICMERTGRYDAAGNCRSGKREYQNHYFTQALCSDSFA